MSFEGGDHRIWLMSSDDREVLSMSGLLDEAGYRQRANLPEGDDAVAHYLSEGWRQGLNPYDGFDGEFLRPYYEASALLGPPILSWLELAARSDHRPPTNPIEANVLAEQVRASRFFDGGAYAERLGSGLDPAMHYAVVGEFTGWRASRAFDVSFYLDRNPDILTFAGSPLLHYTNWGCVEGRRAVPAGDRLAFPQLANRRRPSVLVIVHEASRTGAPILGWNIARELATTYNVVSVLMRGGVLEGQFAAVSAATVGPLVWEEWHGSEMSRLAENLVASYQPIYAIANSIETNLLVPALAQLGVPSVALVHEFAAYTRPMSKMLNVLDWATHIVFPAGMVAQSTYDAFPAFAQRRGVHVQSQGPVELPGNGRDETDGNGRHADVAPALRPAGSDAAFLVLGLGAVQIRKGVDLFIAAAAAARRLAPEIAFSFVWVGEGYDPISDSAYSAYLAEQIVRSDLVDTVEMRGAVENLDAAYASADIFFMSSRLDPQPNVGIDAVRRGIPTVCFEGACGTAEILASDPFTSRLVVPHLDAHAAAVEICRLARDGNALAAVGEATAGVGERAYNMERYIERIDGWGRAAAAALHPEDLRTLAESGAIDPDMALPPNHCPPGVYGVEWHVLQQWAVMGVSIGPEANQQFRRPCAGFHPQIYAVAHPVACGEGGENPLAHWIRAGRPAGAWSRRVFSPSALSLAAPAHIRVALHIHLYYVDHARNIAARLAANETSCDLYISTDTEAKARHLGSVFNRHHGAVDIRVMPNLGRDIGPFLTGFRREIIEGGYDMFGHLHGKQSLGVDGPMGDLWREFLWDNLVGDRFRMLDLAAGVFAAELQIGLLMAEDPHVVGWNQNRAVAENLAERMGISLPLDEFFDFPLGTMFWARPAALMPLLDLKLDWTDYPSEPLAGDGTLLHALERLMPFAARCAGLEVAGLRAPGTSW